MNDRQIDCLLGLLEQQNQFLELLVRVVVNTHLYTNEGSMWNDELTAICRDRPWQIRLSLDEIKESLKDEM